jgi:hypothetical protein
VRAGFVAVFDVAMMVSIRCPAASYQVSGGQASQPNGKPGLGSVTAAGATLPVTGADVERRVG